VPDSAPVQPAMPVTSTDAAMSDTVTLRTRRRFPGCWFPDCCLPAGWFPGWPFWDCWFSDWRIPAWRRGVSARITLPFCHAAPQGTVPHSRHQRDMFRRRPR
jgi:hypothetical protein